MLWKKHTGGRDSVGGGETGLPFVWRTGRQDLRPEEGALLTKPRSGSRNELKEGRPVWLEVGSKGARGGSGSQVVKGPGGHGKCLEFVLCTKRSH